MICAGCGVKAGEHPIFPRRSWYFTTHSLDEWCGKCWEKDHPKVKHEISETTRKVVTVGYGGFDDEYDVSCLACSCGWRSSTAYKEKWEQLRAHKVDVLWEAYQAAESEKTERRYS